MASGSGAIKEVLVKRLDGEVHWPGLIHSFAALREPVLLDSSLRSTPFSRYSIVAAEPVTSVELSVGDPQPFEWLRWQVAPIRGAAENLAGLPFLGGWIGFLAYEVGSMAEPRLFRGRRDPILPAARFGLYDTAGVFDHADGVWYVVAVEWGASVNRPPAKERLRRIEEALLGLGIRDGESSQLPASSFAAPTMSRRAFVDRVQRIQDYIRAGDVYQVNLALAFDAQTDATPEVLYDRLRRVSPSGHSAFLRCGDTAILSSSPELFLHLRDRVVTTRPIKGTRPRTGHAHQDQAHRAELATSAKDHAELNMIVDLMRNDLGRVCDFGSVRVDDAGTIEAHPTVFHRVATISGRLRKECEACDLLAATFPCGSITGAPKIRAMQIIEELEPAPRGVYCGAIGYFGLDGAMQLNVGIRTMVQRGRQVRLYAGSGIVADSDPDLEYEETLAKAKAMLMALNTKVGDDMPVPQVAIA